MEIYQTEVKDLSLGENYCRLRYSLLAEPAKDRTRYGVSVFNETTGEETVVPDALLDPNTGERLLEMLVSGGVTPMTLRDVVEDFVAEI